MDQLSRYTIIELFRLLSEEADDKWAEKLLNEIIIRYRDALAIKLKAFAGIDGGLIKEVLNDLFLDVWTGRRTLHAVKSPDAWLLRVARNKIIDSLKRDEKEKRQMAGYVEDYLRNPENHPFYDRELEKRMEERISKAINQLPPQQRRIFNLAKVERLPIGRIAESLRRREQAIKNQLGLAKKKLRDWLSKDRKEGWK